MPPGTGAFLVNIQDHCGADFTYVINGETATFHNGDLHNIKYDEKATFWTYGNDFDGDGCFYNWTVYPSDDFRAQFKTTNPMVYTATVVLVFAFTALVFVLYDTMVQRRQAKVLSSATRSKAIVSSLFPKGVGERLMEEVENTSTGRVQLGARSNLAEYLNDKKEWKASVAKLRTTKPLADLFPEATVMFGDIVGFTAWSSTRSPSDVFVLLETIYQ